MVRVEDYTQDVRTVMASEKSPYPREHKAEDRERLFKAWVEANPNHIAEIEGWALYIDMMGGKVSTKYLIEKERYEGTCGKATAIPFVDGSGTPHRYSINNSDTALLARWLLKRHPSMNIETRRSLSD